jgi:hypothetical protein
MDHEQHPEPHEYLRSLYQRVKDFEPDFPSPDDLQMLGIQAFQVATANDGTIKFNPCFFLPHSERLFQRYPLDDIIGSRPRTLRSPTPTLEDVLKDEPRLVLSDPEDLSNAKRKLKWKLEWKLECRDTFKDDWSLHAMQVHSHIEQHLSALRKGPTEPFRLSDLAGQAYWL